jgi:hypothetical protein
LGFLISSALLIAIVNASPLLWLHAASPFPCESLDSRGRVIV